MRHRFPLKVTHYLYSVLLLLFIQRVVVALRDILSLKKETKTKQKKHCISFETTGQLMFLFVLLLLLLLKKKNKTVILSADMM